MRIEGWQLTLSTGGAGREEGRDQEDRGEEDRREEGIVKKAAAKQRKG